MKGFNIKRECCFESVPPEVESDVSELADAFQTTKVTEDNFNECRDKVCLGRVAFLKHGPGEHGTHDLLKRRSVIACHPSSELDQLLRYDRLRIDQ